MIIVGTNSPAESAALVNLLEVHGWPSNSCATVRDIARLVHREVPKLIVMRYALQDGFADDVAGILTRLRVVSRVKLVVLLTVNTSIAVHTRLIRLGIECVLRDPVRGEILLSYVDRLMGEATSIVADAAETQTPPIQFAGAAWQANDRSLRFNRRTVTLTPRETVLVELLAHSNGAVLSYETMYGEILGRRFRGETSNMRVLLGKLSASLEKLGISLREWIEVIPKTGYRYRAGAETIARRRTSRTAN